MQHGAEPEVAFEWRPHGYPRPPWIVLAAYAAVLLLGLAMLIDLLEVARMPSVSWEWRWGIVQATGTDPTGSVRMVSGLSPLAWLLLVLSIEGYRVAWVRSARYRLVGGRLVVRWGVFWPKTREVQLDPEPRLERVRGGARLHLAEGGPLRLAGMSDEDEAAFRSALAREGAPGD